jgi:hypothetical protein
MLEPVRRKSRVLPLAVLVILVAVNAALIAVLLWSQRQVTVEPAGQLPITSTAQASPAQAESPSASPSPSPSSEPPTDEKVVVPTRLLVATSATKAWRATVGDCKKHGLVERSADGGKSWRRAVKPILGPIVQLGVESNGNLYTVGGAGADCSIRYVSYSTDGAIAAQTGTPRGIWSRDPKDSDQIQGPGSARATPCKRQHIVGLAPSSTSEALIICTDGSVMVTSDSGKSWRAADELVGAMAVGAGGGRFWVAGRGQNCDGIAIRSFLFTAEKLSRDSSLCVADLPVIPGKIAIDISGKAIWLWAGKKIQVSTDTGGTWKTP